MDAQKMIFAAAVHELKTRQKARSEILEFTKYTFGRPYDVALPHVVMAKEIDAFLAGDTQNLIICVPPQHGKTELSTRRLNAFVLGRDPDAKVATLSYSSTPARAFNKDVRNIMSSPAYKNLFPETSISKTEQPKRANKQTKSTKNAAFDNDAHHVSDIAHTNTANEFSIFGRRGGARFVGVGGGLTSFTVDYLIIDDPFKDFVDSQSPASREKLWNWYLSTAETRLHNNSKQIIVMTRWHDDDLVGRIMKSKFADNFKVVTLRAIREHEGENEAATALYDPRKIGESLWETKHSAERLRLKKEVTPYIFSALYQQRPPTAESSVFKKDQFQIVAAENLPAAYFNAKTDFMIDPAFTENKKNDPSGILSCRRVGSDLYITDYENVYLETTNLCQKIAAKVVQHGSVSQSRVYIEEFGGGKPVVSVARQAIELDGQKIFLNVNGYLPKYPKAQKLTRAKLIEPVVGARRVKLVQGAWNAAFIESVCSFTGRGSVHDEEVDCLVMGVELKMRGSGESVGIDFKKMQGLG